MYWVLQIFVGFCGLAFAYQVGDNCEVPARAGFTAAQLKGKWVDNNPPFWKYKNCLQGITLATSVRTELNGYLKGSMTCCINIPCKGHPGHCRDLTKGESGGAFIKYSASEAVCPGKIEEIGCWVTNLQSLDSSGTLTTADAPISNSADDRSETATDTFEASGLDVALSQNPSPSFSGNDFVGNPSTSNSDGGSGGSSENYG